MCIREDNNRGSVTSSVPGHLQCQAEVMAELADLVLHWGLSGETFVCHTQILAARSSILANLISIALNSEAYGQDGLLEIQIDMPSAPKCVQETKRQAIFLKHLYAFEEVKIDSLNEAAELIELADWFGSPTVLKHAELWCCNQGINHLQCPNNNSMDELCKMFELSMSFRLTRLAALLLPWTLSKLNRGPLADSSTPIWKDVQVRLNTLQCAMGSDIKAIALDLQWWSCGMPQRCQTCECRSGDFALTLHPSYIASLSSTPYSRTITSGINGNTGASCVVNRLPESYLSVSAHVAHSLADYKWGCTPATSCSGSFRPG
jgi:hypothetical protein